MLVVVSPAKKLDMQPVDGLKSTEPAFSRNAVELAAIARDLSLDDLQSLMGLSTNLAQLNADRFAAFGSQDRKAAALAFAGDTYQGLEATSLDPDEMVWAQNHLRILSGLYGILRPLDAIEPYRLEMGTKLSNAKGGDLYDYWGSEISSVLNDDEPDLIINLASNEYFKRLIKKLSMLISWILYSKKKKEIAIKLLGFMQKEPED